jgi:hypothetical protein
MNTFLDLTQVEEKKSNLGVPAGTYSVTAFEAEVKDTKSGGEMIKVRFKVLDGEHTGKFIFHLFNIKNDNPKAVEIGMSQLKSFMTCAGFTNYALKSVTDLCGKRATAVVKIKNDPNYGEQSVISYFKAYSGNTETTEQGDGLPF